MSQTINIEANYQHNYPIHIGSNIWDLFEHFCRENYSLRSLYIIIDEQVASLHGDGIAKHCRSVFKNCTMITVPEGEQSKSVSRWNKLIDKLLTAGVERTTPVLAIGGGVIGDLAGFSAASVLRGIPLIHMPTSLLAMVDSSIGGKTGINHAVGKNLIGAFYQPDAVFADTQYLYTLKPKEWVNGLSEILKYAAIRKPAMFGDSRKCVQKGFVPSREWEGLIFESASIKADVVQKDMLESGVRAHLNFGHTFGHALERYAGYGKISHGEAVMVGMLAAVQASSRLGAKIDHTPFVPFLPLYKLQVDLATVDIKELISLMYSDKKVKDETIRLILLNDWGKPYVYSCSSDEVLQEAWKAAIGLINKHIK